MSFTTKDFPRPAREKAGVIGDSLIETPASSYRDVRDVRLLRSLAITALAQSALLFVSLGVVIYLTTRPAQQVVIERSGEGDRVIAVNGQAVKDGITVGADKPGANDKRTIAREWSAARYGIDPITREKDLEKLFRLMAPRAAKAYSDLLKRNTELERERSERWQAVWTPQIIEMDKKDPYRVNVVGLWEITRNGAQGTQREAKQLMYALHVLVDSEQGRAPRNARTGFLIDDILDYKELAVSNGPASTLTAQ